MTKKSLFQKIEVLPEATVTEYLQRHPDFFTRHEDILATLVIPKDNIILSLEQELKCLQEENKLLRSKLGELIKVAQDNEKLNRRIQHLITTLIKVNGIEDFFQTLYSTLCNEFETDIVVVRCFEVIQSDRQEFVDFDAQIFNLFDDLLKNNNPICGQLSPEQHNYLFPDSKITSAVLIPILANPEPQGLLAMGSHDATRFQADMSTDFLIYLGKLISNLLRIWIR